MIRLLLLLRGKVKEKNKRNNPGGERGLREGEDYSERERERKVGYKEEEGEKFVCLCRKLGRKRNEGKKLISALRVCQFHREHLPPMAM